MLDTAETLWEHRDLFTVLAKLDYGALAKYSLILFIITAAANYFFKSHLPLFITLGIAAFGFINWGNKNYEPAIKCFTTAISLFAGGSLGGFLGGCSPFRKKSN